MFLVCLAASYLTLQEPQIKQWLARFSVLVRLVVFIALAGILSIALNSIVSTLLAIPRGFVYQESGVNTAFRCLGGLLVLGGLAYGGYLLLKDDRPAG